MAGWFPTSSIPAPSVYMDFAGGYYIGDTLTNLLSCSRASTGYAQTVGGTLVSFSNNILRITDQGLLIEEARTNLALQSQTFDNAAWTKTATTITADDTIAPDGTLTADKAVESNTSTSIVSSAATFTVVNGSTYTVSYYVKSSNIQWVRVGVADTTSRTNGTFAWFDLTNAAVGSSAAFGAGWAAATNLGITPLAGGWFRVSFTAVAVGTAMVSFVSSAIANSSNTRVASGTYWPWQVDAQLGAFATSPIPTTTVAVARAADNVALIGTASTALNLAAMSSLVISNSAKVVTGSTFVLSRDSSNTMTSINSDTAIRSRVNATNLAATLGSGAFSTGRVKSGYAQDATGRSVVGNNGNVGTDANTGSAGVSNNLGSSGGSTLFPNLLIERLALWPSRLPDATLKALTA